MSTPSPWGAEFLVNTSTAGDQNSPSATALANGRYVIAWTNGDIRAQIYQADGTRIGTEFLVNATTANAQYDPTIAALAEGGFVVAWTDTSSTGGDTSGYAVRAQVFDADGTKNGGEFLVNTTTASYQTEPTITVLSNGNFVVAWSDQSASGGDASLAAVRAQIFAADGVPVGAEFLVNTTTTGNQGGPTITALTDGRFVAAWADGSGSPDDTSYYAVRAQIFNANGDKSGGEFLVNATTTNTQWQPAVTALAGGGFAITWSDEVSSGGGDSSGAAVRAQVFNASGVKTGGEFLVNTNTTYNQDQPVIARLADNRFVIAWSDTSHADGDNLGYAVRAQVFNTDGTKSGAEFLANTTVAGNQFGPTITTLADGRFVVAWTDDSQTGGDTSGYAVRAQVFDPRLAAVSIPGTTLNDEFVGTKFDDTLYGGAGNDSLDGAGGADTLIGEGGNDRYIVNTLGDVIIELAGKGADLVMSEISYSLVDTDGAGSDGGNVEKLTLTGTAVKATGNTLANTLIGNSAANTLDGGTGADTMLGQAGNDTYIVDNTGDKVYETTTTSGSTDAGGTDLVKSGVGFTLGSFIEKLTLTGTAVKATGNALANTLTGNSAANTLIGGGGDDTLVGGGGKDSLTGGTGDDVFDFNTPSDSLVDTNRDVIKDFAHGDGIDLSSIDANTAMAGNQAFTLTTGAAFSGSFTSAGKLYYDTTSDILWGNNDADTQADFSILVKLSGLTTLVAGDFSL